MRRQNTIRFILFQEYETAAFAEYLEEMARKGWYLKKIYNSSILRFERGEARRLKFAVAVLPDSSQFDSPDREEAVRFRELCEEAGWKLQCGGNLWQVFYSEKENPVPLETDPLLQLTIQEENSLSLGRWVSVFVLSALFLFQVSFVFKDPGRHLALPVALRSFVVHILLAVVFPAGMLRILLWYTRARRLLEQGLPAPAVTLRRVRIRNGLWSAAAIMLIASILWDSGMHAWMMAALLAVGIIAVIVPHAILTWVQEHGSGDRGESAVGYFVGSFVTVFLLISLVFGLVTRFFPSEDPARREAYVRKEPFPVTFEELGYEPADDWRRESEKTFLSFYQIETGEQIDEEGKESSLTMTYYKSPFPAIISWTKSKYPISRGNVWEITASENVGQDGVTVGRYHYSMRSDDMMHMEGWYSDARDLYVISDRNRILVLEYSSAADESEVETAIAGFRQTAETER